MSATPRNRANSSRKLNRGVIAQVEVALAAVGREEVDDHQHVGRLLFHLHAVAVHQVGQDRLGHGDAVLHEHLGHVQIDAQLEGDRQRVAAVVAALAGHVQHPLDAVDLLLDGGGHGVRHGLRIGAGIGGGYLHRRRRDLRILGHGQRPDGDAAGQGDDDGQHGGEDRPMDEKSRKHVAASIPGSMKPINQQQGEEDQAGRDQ